MNNSENIQNLVELKQQMLIEKEKEHRLFLFATEGKKNLEEIEKMSDVNTIGANYYLSEYLPEFLKGIEPSATPVDFTIEEQELEKKFMDQMLPVITKQTLIMNENDSFQPEDMGAAVLVAWADKLGKATLDNSLQQIISQRADISMQKLADKQAISLKDYGFIITKIALYVGDSMNLSEYNMLYLGLYHELSQNQQFGSYADEYLKQMALKTGYFTDDIFFQEDDNKSIKR